MKVKVNKRSYSVCFKKADDIDVDLLGFTDYKSASIEVLNDSDKELIKSTLIHELTHAYLFEHGIRKSKYELEEVCDFLGIYAEEIITKANQILNKIKKEKK